MMDNTSGFFSLVPLIVFLPVLGMLINLIFGSKFSEKGIGAVAATASGLAFVVAVLQAYSLSVAPAAQNIPVAQWIHIGTLVID